MSSDQTVQARAALTMLVRLLDQRKLSEDNRPIEVELYCPVGEAQLTLDVGALVPALQNRATTSGEREYIALRALPQLSEAKKLAVSVLLDEAADVSSALADYMMELGIDYVKEVEKKAVEKYKNEQATIQMRRSQSWGSYRQQLQGPIAHVNEDLGPIYAGYHQYARIGNEGTWGSHPDRLQAVQATGMVPDTREGWSRAMETFLQAQEAQTGVNPELRPLLEAENNRLLMNLAAIRPAGRPIRSQPLIDVDYAGFEARANLSRELWGRVIQGSWLPVADEPHRPMTEERRRRTIETASELHQHRVISGQTFRQQLGVGVTGRTFTRDELREIMRSQEVLDGPPGGEGPPGNYGDPAQVVPIPIPFPGPIPTGTISFNMPVTLPDTNPTRRSRFFNPHGEIAMGLPNPCTEFVEPATDLPPQNEDGQFIQWYAYETLGMSGVDARVVHGDVGGSFTEETETQMAEQQLMASMGVPADVLNGVAVTPTEDIPPDEQIRGVSDVPNQEEE